MSAERRTMKGFYSSDDTKATPGESPASAMIRRPRSNRCAGFGVGIASLAFFAFVTSRSFLVPFTHDESFSFLEFAHTKSLKDILFHPEYSAGNHLLNTICLKAASLGFHPDAWTLRLHSLLAYALFLYAGHRICRLLFRPSHQFAAFVLLNMNMFLMQFFSLARGYGLGLGLMMLSLWLFLQSLEQDRGHSVPRSLSLAAGALASFANLSFLNYYGALLVMHAASGLWGWRRKEVKPRALSSFFALARRFWDTGLVTAILAATLLPFAVRLRNLGEFYYGGTRGFVEDTLVSLWDAYRFETSLRSKAEPAVLLWIYGIAALIFVFYAFITLRSRQELPAKRACSVYWILFLSAFSTVIQHHALGTRYLIDRTALLFMPLLVLSTTWFLAYTGEGNAVWMKRKAALLLLAALGLSAWQFAKTVNLRYALEWAYDAKTPDMLKDLEAATHADGNQGTVRLGVTWYLQPSIAFYATVRRLDWLAPVDRGGIKDRPFDFYYIGAEDLDYAEHAGAYLVKRYDLSGTWLFRTNR